MYRRGRVNVLNKRKKAEPAGAPRALGDAHNLIYSIVCFISCPCFAQGCMQICSLENK